jgi:chitin disaccharide deacetylase
VSNERFLILNADDFGMCHSTNEAINTLFTEGAITSASLMMTCPWTLEAIHLIKKNPSMDVGIHLTHTSEWNVYKWGPLSSNMNTLVDKNGYFPADTDTALNQADPDQLREEAIAQIEFALKSGLDPTNIDNHMGSMHHVMDILLDLCERYQLPLRYAKQGHSFRTQANHEEIIAHADKKGIQLPDHIEMLPFFAPEGKEPAYQITKEAAINCIHSLKPGVTELVFHPSLDTSELKGITETWPMRRFEFDIFRDEEIQELLRSENIQLIQWRDLRNRQRQMR